MIGVACARAAAAGLGVGERGEQRHGGMPVDAAVVDLVGVGQQAVVAALFAALARAGGLPLVRHPVRAVVDNAQRFGSHLGQGVAVFAQAPQHSGAALGALGQQDPSASFGVGQRFAGQFGVFQLIDGFDRAFERVLQRGGGGLVELLSPAQHQDIASVLDVRDDASAVLGVLDRGQIVDRVVAAVGVLALLQPSPAGQVEEVPIGFLIVRTFRAAQVDHAHRRGVAVGHLGQQRSVGVVNLGIRAAGSLSVVGEPVGGQQSVAGAASLLLVRGDHVAAYGEDRLQAHEVVLLGAAQWGGAVLAAVRVGVLAV